MPSGIILSSSSQGATKEAIEAVLEKHGYETDKLQTEGVEATETEPKLEDFENEEAFEEAKAEFEEKQEAAVEEAERKAEEEEEKKAPKLTRKQKAIERATREAREENRQLRERVAALEGKGKGAEAEAPVKIEIPKREKYKTDQEFEEAMFDYRYQVRRAKEAHENAQQQMQARLKENLQNYQTGVADFKEKHDDWDEVVNQPIPIHESTYLAVMELENGPAVTYYLGKHPDYTRKLAEMSPLSAAMEVGRLSSRLKTGAPNRGAADGGVKQKPKQRLPEPVKPASTSATSSTLTSSEAAKKRDYRAFKTAQRAGR
jgi:hypothetical protein